MSVALFSGGVDTFATDLRFTWRSLRANRGFAAAVLLSLSLGLGATTAVFTAVYGILLRPLPYRDAERLAIVRSTFSGSGVDDSGASLPDFEVMRARSRAFSAMVAGYVQDRSLVTDGPPERVRTGILGAGAFAMLGAPLAIGREAAAAEAVWGRHQVVVLSQALYQRRFGGDPRALGRSVRLDGEDYRIIGVAGSAMGLPAAGLDLFVPLAFAPGDPYATRGNHYLTVMGRLAPGASVASAAAEMRAVAAALAVDYAENQGVGARVVSLRESLTGKLRPGLLMLFGAVGLLLLITCANLANLLLARGVSRQRELNVRAALGASRTRLVRQLVTESVLLALAGGAGGLLVGIWLQRAIMALGPESFRQLSLEIDGGVLLFALALSLVTGVAFGVAPALLTSQTAVAQGLRQSTRATGSRSANRLRQGLVAGEVALSLVLVVGAGLLARSFFELRQVPLGFRPKGVLTGSFNLGLRQPTDAPKVRQVMTAVMSQLSSVPGVTAAGLASTVPMDGNGWGKMITVEGRPRARLDQVPIVQYHLMAGDAFGALGMSAVAGRLLDARDQAGTTSVCVINQAAARLLFGFEDPIGKRVFLMPPEALIPRQRLAELPPALFERLTIVGIVRDVRAGGPSAPAPPEVYQTWGQANDPASWAYVVVRSGLAPAVLGQAVREAVARVRSDLPLADIKPLDAYLGESIALTRFHALLLEGFAVLASILALLGVYGVTSYLLGQRTRELGIRMALGATPRQILTMVLARGLGWVSAGVAVGLLGAVALRRFLAALLFGVQPADLGTYSAAACLLLGAGALALYLPARRAARLQPAIALSED